MRTQPLVLFGLVIICLTVLGSEDLAAKPMSWNPQSTYAVVIGLVEWQDPEYDDFPAQSRKDLELYRTLIARGIPDSQIVYLQDKLATRKQMRETVLAMLKKAPKDSTFLFYYEGHGVRDEDDVAFLASYDIVTDKEAATGFPVLELVKTISENFKGSHVLLLGDYCFSGELKLVAKKLAKRGFKAMSLTSSMAESSSTGNWTFTQTLIDGFKGEHLYDHNADGKITLEELHSEVAQAMKFRENQMSGFANYGFEFEFVVANTTPYAPLRTKIGDYVLAKRIETYEPARVIEILTDSYLVQFYDYSDKFNLWVTADQIKMITFKMYPAGSKIRVEYDGDYYDATVVKVVDGFHYVSYDEYDDSWKEWVMADRIKERT